jgi:protein-S-isoprenylcysteine O-methyltransferase Ste14
MILWACAAFEILFYVGTIIPTALPAPFASSPLCFTSQPNIRFTPFFAIGVVAVVLGTYIRLDCFHTLGQLFTFDLTIHPEHKLITSRFYAYVRHPSYTGSILLIAGLAFSHLTEGSWLTECGPLRAPGSATIVWVLWWMWTLAVAVSRAEAEDKQMRKLFHEEWETYAAHVPWWFLPGLI